jgi:hypothetical protein
LITIEVDGDSRALSLPTGSNVREAIDLARIELGPLDRSEPAATSELANGDTVLVIRVEEEFEIEEAVMPFESRTLQNESLPAGEQRLIQSGANGVQEITYRLLYENGELVSRSLVRASTITAPIEEIIMIGAQSPFNAVPIPGQLAFISAGNAWVMEISSGSRRAVVVSGDLDGRVFEISPDGDWLLFTRQSGGEQINTLWVASLREGLGREINLGVENVVHYAGWAPGGSATQVAFSTASYSPNPPGWQARNDLQFLNFTASGDVTVPRVGLPAQTDGLYSWWGSDYAWSPSGELAFARPDAIGFVDIDADELEIALPLTTFQTRSDWAWVPGIAWSPDDARLYTVEHAEQDGLEFQQQSTAFDLIAIENNDERVVEASVGMFAEPQTSPLLGDEYWLAFLRAYVPGQSDISAYQLVVTDPEANEIVASFPPEGAPGLQPQQVAWSPEADGSLYIAFVYQGNLWVLDVFSGEAEQLTGDGLVAALSWR